MNSPIKYFGSGDKSAFKRVRKAITFTPINLTVNGQTSNKKQA